MKVTARTVLYDLGLISNDRQVELESPATLYYTYDGRDEKKRGTLFLLENTLVVFVQHHLVSFEKHHEYYLSQIQKVDGYSDGFKAHVLCAMTEGRPEEVISYFYETKGDVNRWTAALGKTPAPPPAQPVVIREREVIKEIVKVRCGHCGNLYDERQDRCPHCGGR